MPMHSNRRRTDTRTFAWEEALLAVSEVTCPRASSSFCLSVHVCIRVCIAV
jgi:hypothetical protein